MAYELVERCNRAIDEYRAQQRRSEILDDQRACKILWQTDRMVIFEDEAGRV